MSKLCLYVKFLLQALETIQIKLIPSDSPLQCQQQDEEISSVEDLEDVLHYLLDLFSSLRVFLKIFDKAVDAFQKKEFELT